MSFVYLKNTPTFTIKSFKSKAWKKWDAENKKMLSSVSWLEGYRPMYSFELDNGNILEISRDQLSQCLVAAFEAGKPLAGMSFVAKDNGKEGLEKRWYINQAKNAPKAETKPEITESDIPW